MFKKKLVMCFMASIFFSNMSYAAEKDDLTPAQMEKIAKMTANPIVRRGCYGHNMITPNYEVINLMERFHVLRFNPSCRFL